MAESWQFILNTVLARVRDQGANLHSLMLCMDLLTRLQRLYNNHRRLVVEDFTLTTQPHLQLYTLTEATGDNVTTGPQGMTALRIRHQGRNLERLTLPQLRALDPAWPRATGQRFEGFVQLGFSYILLWPALLTQDSVTVTATKLTQNISEANVQDELDIPSQSTPHLAQLLELVLLLRQRDLDAFNILYQKLNPGVRHGTEAAPTS